MQKIKLINFNRFFKLLKCSLIGIVATLIGTILFSVILKFTNLSSMFISYINDFIKAVSIFLMVIFIKKNNQEKLLINSIIGGLLYALLCFLLFSILSGTFFIDLSFLYNLLFDLIVSAIVSIIVNIVGHKTM